MDVDLAVRGVTLEQLARVSGTAGVTGGPLNLAVTLQGNGVSPAALMASASGSHRARCRSRVARE